MACSVTLAGLAVGCKDSMGGLRKVYIAQKSDISTITLTADVITAITMAGSAVFKKYEFRKEVSSLTTTANTDDKAASLYYTSELALQFSKMDTEKRIEFMALMQANCVVIAEDNNGKFWFLGYDHEVTATAGTAQTGAAYSDLNGYNITLTDASKVLPYEVNESVIATVI